MNALLWVLIVLVCLAQRAQPIALPWKKLPTSVKNNDVSVHKQLTKTFNKSSAMLGIDVIDKNGKLLSADEVAYNEALRNTIYTFVATGLFAIGVFVVKGQKSCIEFVTGFLVEKSLSIDNLFVFLMLFKYFKVPTLFQNRVLTWGLVGALAMRAVMILVGVQIVHRFKWVTLLFSGILIFSSYKLLTDHETEDDVGDNAIIKYSKLFVRSTNKFDNEKFFTVENGQRMATPLLMCLISVELSDFVFAVDSIPAVLGVSKDAFIVYSSNVFAIMGMRSLYVLIAQAVSSMRYLKPSVAAVLGFVGLKMVAEYFHYEVSPFLSLAVIGSILTLGCILSVLHSRRNISSSSTVSKKE